METDVLLKENSYNIYYCCSETVISLFSNNAVESEFHDSEILLLRNFIF